jgi:hypothetical protein
VSSVLLSESAARNGLKVPVPADFSGIALVHVVDAQGAFVRMENADHAIEEMLGRVTEQNVRDALRAVLTPQALETRVKRGWELRFRDVCNRELAPAESFLMLDDQDIPVAGHAVSVVRETVTGISADAARDVLSIRLAFGGRGSADVAAAQAAGLFANVEGGTSALTEELTGEGERYVSPRTCQTTRERAKIDGEIRVNRAAAQASGMTSFPTRIQFEVEREVVRETPAPAQ